MKYVDYYVAEVGRHLPEKTRVDIENEIRSLIEDTLEDESQKQGRPVDEEMVMSVLKRLGRPEKMAASYQPPSYLIGPELFPYFIKTLRIVLSVLAVLAAIGVGVSIGKEASTPTGLVTAIAQGIGGLLNAAIQALGVVVIVFAILQWSTPGFKAEVLEWDPHMLRAEPDPEKVKIADAILEIFFGVLGIIVLYFYSDWIGISNYVNGAWVHAPLLNDIFFRFLPWLSLVWVLEAAHNIWLVSQGRWTPALRWSQVVIKLLNIGLLAAMLLGPSFITLDPQSLSKLGWDISAAQAETASQRLFTAIRLAFGIALVVDGVKVIQQVFRLVIRGRLPEPLLQ